jgi:hypothetical protein
VTTVTITPAGDNNVVDIIEGATQTHNCTPVVLMPAGFSGILEDRTRPIKQHHSHHNKMETSLYHQVVWCIQGEMLITTKLSSVKLLILMGERK